MLTLNIIKDIMASSTMTVAAATATTNNITIVQDTEEIDGNDLMNEWTIDGTNATAGSNPESTDDALEDIPRGNSNINSEDCAVCMGKLSSPRLLSCLHVFCEVCLDKLIVDKSSTDATINTTINCPLCEQQTTIGPKGASSLPCDYVLTNILDMSAIETMTVLCTSCKAKENAVARCSDCANFLCPNCNTAHQFMRCFESHKVIAFEDLKRSNKAVPIHKPIFCELHPAENMKFYCYTCQVCRIE